VSFDSQSFDKLQGLLTLIQAAKRVWTQTGKLLGICVHKALKVKFRSLLNHALPRYRCRRATRGDHVAAINALFSVPSHHRLTSA
jgi:hypothetical protein